MSAAEAPDPVPYAEKLGIAPEDLERSTAFIHQPQYLQIPKIEAALKAFLNFKIGLQKKFLYSLRNEIF